MENHAAGVVTNCLRAALYQEPRANSKVLTVITALTRVSVNMDEPTDAFYKVSTSNGTQGVLHEEVHRSPPVRRLLWRFPKAS